jgi:hypothetical protein
MTPFSRIQAHFREAVEAGREAGREARERAVAEHGQAAYDEQTPGWVNRWLDANEQERKPRVRDLSAAEKAAFQRGRWPMAGRTSWALVGLRTLRVRTWVDGKKVELLSTSPAGIRRTLRLLREGA